MNGRGVHSVETESKWEILSAKQLRLTATDFITKFKYRHNHATFNVMYSLGVFPYDSCQQTQSKTVLLSSKSVQEAQEWESSKSL